MLIKHLQCCSKGYMKLRVMNDNYYIQFVLLFSFGCTDQDNPDSHIFNNHAVNLIILYVVAMYKLE